MARVESEVRRAGRGAGLLDWIDARFPLTKMMREHATEYYAAKNFNVWYVFGVLALLVLVIQIVTGIFLTMNYKPAAADAFASVEYIMRDVEWGWLIRYMHSTGASAFFIVVYLHMFRAMLYGSYKKAARTDLDHRHADFPRADGRGVFRLPACPGGRCRTGARRSLCRCLAQSLPSAKPWSSGFAATTPFPTSR